MAGATLEPLESAVMRMLLDGDHPTLGALRAQLQHLTVSSRKKTGAGFYTDFVPETSAVPIDLPGRIQFGDVVARAISGLQYGGGFVLFIEHGLMTMLEGYSFGDDWPDDGLEFDLQYDDPARPGIETTFG
jgi:hypothetical protein